MNIMKFPFIMYMSNKGELGFSPDFQKYDELKEKNVDIWVVNDRSQFADIQTCHRLFLKHNSLFKITKPDIKKLRRGTQIVYLPTHLLKDADISNLDIQFGFVTSHKGPEHIFCRYFSRHDLSTLRTLSCSEGAYLENIYMLNTFEKPVIKFWLKYIDDQEKTYKKQLAEPWIRLER